jgi:hypothetical protein
MSRRQFVRMAGGAIAVGVALGSGLRLPGLALAHGAHQPVPIPGGSPAIQAIAGGLYHVFGPAPAEADLDPLDAEPSTITDFDGFVGLAYLDGSVTRTNVATGETRTLPFMNTDMRFMKGYFRGTDGQIHEGAWAFV